MLKSLSLNASTPGWSVGLDPDQGLGLAISHFYMYITV